MPRRRRSTRKRAWCGRSSARMERNRARFRRRNTVWHRRVSPRPPRASLSMRSSPPIAVLGRISKSPPAAAPPLPEVALPSPAPPYPAFPHPAPLHSAPLSSARRREERREDSACLPAWRVSGSTSATCESSSSDAPRCSPCSSCSSRPRVVWSWAGSTLWRGRVKGEG